MPRPHGLQHEQPKASFFHPPITSTPTDPRTRRLQGRSPHLQYSRDLFLRRHHHSPHCSQCKVHHPYPLSCHNCQMMPSVSCEHMPVHSISHDIIDDSLPIKGQLFSYHPCALVKLFQLSVSRASIGVPNQSFLTFQRSSIIT